MTPQPDGPPMAQKSWFGRNWKWLLPVGCGTPLLCCLSFAAVTYFTVTKVIGASPVFAQALQRANDNPEVKAALGTPVTPGFGLQGSMNETNGEGTADVTAPLEGPKGKGTMHLRATGRGGRWTFQQLDVEAGGKTISLLEAEAPPQQDPEPAVPDEPADDDKAPDEAGD